MKTFTLICAALALAVAATPAPAQVSIRAGVTIGARGHDHGRHDHGRHDHGHRSHGNHRHGHDRHDRGHHNHGHSHGHIHVNVHRPTGYWRTVYDEVTIPGYWREEHVPARYGWTVDSCGHRCWGIVEVASCRRVWVPARCESRPRRVWVSC